MTKLVIALLLLASFSVAIVMVGLTTTGAAIGAEEGLDSLSSSPQTCSVESVQKPSCGCGCRLASEECTAGGCPLYPEGCPQ